MKDVCVSCGRGCQWLFGLTLVAIGGSVLLIKLEVVPVTVWEWLWPLLILIWGVAILLHIGCPTCK